MTIHATVSKDGKQAKVTWKGGKIVEKTGDKRMIFHIMDRLTPRCFPFYNPALGGPYTGFDINDPLHVLDAFQDLASEGFTVDVDDGGIDHGAIDHADYPFDLDARNDFEHERVLASGGQALSDGVLGFGEGVCICARLPEAVARKFPVHDPDHDSRPTSIKLLHIGAVPASQWDTLISLVGRALRDMPSLPVKLTGKTRKVDRCRCVVAQVPQSMVKIRSALRAALQASGISVEGDADYKPCVVWCYGAPPPLPVPDDMFALTRFEIWGLPRHVTFDLRAPKGRLIDTVPQPVNKAALFSFSQELIKGKKGEEMPGHKWRSRDPLPGGGFRYHYFDDKGTAKHHDVTDPDHPHHAKHADLPTTQEDIDAHTNAISGALDRLPDGMKITTPQGSTFTKKGDNWHRSGGDPVPGEKLVDEAAKEGAKEGWGRDEYVRAFRAGLWAFIEGAVPGRNPHWRADFVRREAAKQQAKPDTERAAAEDAESEQIRQETGVDPEPPKVENMSVEEMNAELAEQRRALKDVARHKLVSKQLEAARKAVQEAKQQAGLTQPQTPPEASEGAKEGKGAEEAEKPAEDAEKPKEDKP